MRSFGRVKQPVYVVQYGAQRLMLQTALAQHLVARRRYTGVPDGSQSWGYKIISRTILSADFFQLVPRSVDQFGGFKVVDTVFIGSYSNYRSVFPMQLNDDLMISA